MTVDSGQLIADNDAEAAALDARLFYLELEMSRPMSHFQVISKILGIASAQIERLERRAKIVVAPVVNFGGSDLA